MVKVSAALLLLAIFCIPVKSRASSGLSDTAVQWLKPAELATLMRSESRPVLVDVYTSWCHYCKVMDATTWKNDSLAAYVNRNFHAVKLNAEDRDTLTWDGKTYVFKPKYNLNELAISLLRGNMVFPSTVLIPEKGDIQIIPGALSAAKMELLLKYYGSRSNEQKAFMEFQQAFSGSWK